MYTSHSFKVTLYLLVLLLFRWEDNEDIDSADFINYKKSLIVLLLTETMA